MKVISPQLLILALFIFTGASTSGEKFLVCLWLAKSSAP